MTECAKCGVLLSAGYPWNLCKSCWEEKYNAPPGWNYVELRKESRMEEA